jgi:hypothetical protein
MTITALGLMLLGAGGIAIHVEDARDVSEQQIGYIVADLSSAIARRTGETPRISTFEPGEECGRKDRCVGSIRSETGADDIVFVRLFAAPTRVRVVAELVDDSKGIVQRARADLSRSRRRITGATELEAIDALAGELFPSGTPPPAKPVAAGITVAATTSPMMQLEQDDSRLWPWWVIGGSVVAGGFGAWLGLQNTRARDEGMMPGVPPSRVDELQDRTFATGMGANILIGVAATGLITGTVLLLTE